MKAEHVKKAVQAAATKVSNATSTHYAGNALAKQEPGAKPLTIAGQMKAANEGITLALKRMAELMSDDMPLPALTGAYFLMRKEWNPILAKLDKAANAALKEHTQKEGEAGLSEGGGEVRTMDVDFSGAKFRSVTTEALASKPDLKLLSAETGLPETSFTEQVISREYSQDKIDKLLANGKITQAQIDKARKVVSVSLKVEKI